MVHVSTMQPGVVDSPTTTAESSTVHELTGEVNDKIVLTFEA